MDGSGYRLIILAGVEAQAKVLKLKSIQLCCSVHCEEDIIQHYPLVHFILVDYHSVDG